MVHLLRKDNEELGVICVKIVINFNRTYRTILEPHIMPFVEWIVGLYEGMATVVGRTFSDEVSGASSSPSTAFAGLNSEVGSIHCIHSLIPSLHCFVHGIERKSTSTTSAHLSEFQSPRGMSHRHRPIYK